MDEERPFKFDNNNNIELESDLVKDSSKASIKKTIFTEGFFLEMFPRGSSLIR